MNKEQYKQLEDKIKEAVPEIMELKKGCYITGMGHSCAEILKINGEKITVLHGGYRIDTENMQDIEEFCEIIGRDITLEDVLVAMSKELLEKFIDIKWSANHIVLIDNRLDNIRGDDRCIWIMGKPLSEQREETKQFLCNLLVKK